MLPSTSGLSRFAALIVETTRVLLTAWANFGTLVSLPSLSCCLTAQQIALFACLGNSSLVTLESSAIANVFFSGLWYRSNSNDQACCGTRRTHAINTAKLFSVGCHSRYDPRGNVCTDDCGSVAEHTGH